MHLSLRSDLLFYTKIWYVSFKATLLYIQILFYYMVFQGSSLAVIKRVTHATDLLL